MADDTTKWDVLTKEEKDFLLQLPIVSGPVGVFGIVNRLKEVILGQGARIVELEKELGEMTTSRDANHEHILDMENKCAKARTDLSRLRKQSAALVEAAEAARKALESLSKETRQQYPHLAVPYRLLTFAVVPFAETEAGEPAKSREAFGAKRCGCGKLIYHAGERPKPEHICRDCNQELCEACCDKRKAAVTSPPPPPADATLRPSMRTLQQEFDAFVLSAAYLDEYRSGVTGPNMRKASELYSCLQELAKTSTEEVPEWVNPKANAGTGGVVLFRSLNGTMWATSTNRAPMFSFRTVWKKSGLQERSANEAAHEFFNDSQLSDTKAADFLKAHPIPPEMMRELMGVKEGSFAVCTVCGGRASACSCETPTPPLSETRVREIWCEMAMKLFAGRTGEFYSVWMDAREMLAAIKSESKVAELRAKGGA